MANGRISKTFRLVFSWKANGIVNVPIIFSFIGFFYAALLFLPFGCGDSYHDLEIQNKKEIRNEQLAARIKKMKQVYDSLLPKKDSSKDFKQVRNLLQGSINEKFRLDHANADTNIDYYAAAFNSNRKDFYNALVNTKDDTSSIHVPVVLIDSAILSYDTSTSYKSELIIQKTPKKIEEFVTKYPDAGFLYLLSIGQMVAWCLIVALVFGSLLKTNNILPAYQYNWKNGSIHFILPTITLVLFSMFFYLWLINDHVIKDSYFLDHFTSRMSAYSIPGYIAAIFCFSSYLFLSNKLELLDSTGVAPTSPDYSKLKSAFDFSFFCSALILSLFVFFLGVLFHATNDIEAMHFYSLVSGKPFINYNYVYLTGLMHSILLAIFYIPVKIRFNSMEVAQRAGGGGTKVLKVLWESLRGILVTLSPLLATVVEKLVNAIIG